MFFNENWDNKERTKDEPDKAQEHAIAEFNAWLNLPQLIGIYIHIISKLICIMTHFKKEYLTYCVLIGFSSFSTNIFMGVPAFFVKDYHIIIDPIIKWDREDAYFLISVLFAATFMSVTSSVLLL